MEENIEIARRFVDEYLVSRGMIADLAVHLPKKSEGEPENPHIHILLPIRPLKEDGSWGIKQKKVPMVDEEGNPIFNENGKQKMRAVPTTDWSSVSSLRSQRSYPGC